MSNATVKVVGTNRSKLKELEGSLDAAQEESSEILSQVDNPEPQLFESYKSKVSNQGWNNVLPSDDKYVAAHETSQWENRFGSIAAGVITLDDPQLGEPAISVPADETVVLSTWDASNGGLLQDSVNSDLPGSTTDSDVIIQPLGPGGSFVGGNYTAETEDYAQTGYNTHQAAEVKLSPGVYRLVPEGGGTATYVVAGNYLDIVSGFEDEAQDKLGQVSNRTQYIKDQIDQDKVIPETVVTNETGHFSMNTNSHVSRVGLIAYKGPYDRMGSDPVAIAKNTSRNDIREFVNSSKYNGSVYVPTSMNQYDVGQNSQDIEVTTREFSTPSYLDLNRTQEAWEWFNDYLENHSYAEALSALDQRLEDVSGEELRQTYLEQYNLVQQNQALRDRLNDATNESWPGAENATDAENLTRSELSDRITELENTLNQVQESVDSSEGSSEIVNETLSASRTFGTDLSSENVMAIVHYANGTSTTVNSSSDYISIEANTIGGDTVSLNEYPIGDTPAASVEWRVASSDGVGNAIDRATNPAFSGDIPALKSVDFTSLNPGPSENVRVRVNPKDTTGFAEVVDVQTRAPDGSTIPTTLDGEREASFETAGDGVYHVAITYQNAGEQNFTVAQRIVASDVDRDMPAEIRVSQSPMGTYALTGETFEGGSVTVNGGGSSVAIAGQVPTTGDPPGIAHVHTHGMSMASDSTTTVSIVRGNAGKTISRNVRVVMHTPALSDAAIAYRSTPADTDEPLPRDDGPAGFLTVRSANATINTYTAETGRVGVRVINSPGILQSLDYRWERTKQQFSFPDLPSVDIPMIGMQSPALGATQQIAG